LTKTGFCPDRVPPTEDTGPAALISVFFREFALDEEALGEGEIGRGLPRSQGADHARYRSILRPGIPNSAFIEFLFGPDYHDDIQDQYDPCVKSSGCHCLPGVTMIEFSHTP
jgi:hypothetical protein